MSPERIQAERERLAKHWKVIGPREARWELRGLVTEPSLEVESWPVLEALQAVPRIGVVSAMRALDTAGISYDASLRGLALRQRVELGEWLVGR
jgi:hypothetical protein